MTTWVDIDTANCSVRRTLALVGEKWTLLLLRDAANGVHRFDEFRRHVGLSEAVLADRLRTLVEHGVFDTHDYREPGRRTRKEYRLSATGWELLPVLVALMQWGDDHLADRDGPPLEVRHRTCGHRVRAVVHCPHDHTVLTHHDTEAVRGPGARTVAA